MKLSNNFWYSEFSDRDHHILTPVQIMMVHALAQNILQPIRDFLCDALQASIPIKISSGIRFPSDHNRLKRQGYNPSETSDHLFGNIVKLKNPVKIKKYGKYYQYSVGAVDWVPSCGAERAWDLMSPYFDRRHSQINLPTKIIKIGQMILEKRNSHWLHTSNPATLIYQDEIANTFLKKEPFLTSLDNGRTYKPIS